ncbi:MAG: thioredoxin fold domain-containing protein [candidate division Zixibacteria bacterium]|nr:thioredoxin fold domain-containing protein [candidate division Zixibacteria bacterium]
MKKILLPLLTSLLLIFVVCGSSDTKEKSDAGSNNKEKSTGNIEWVKFDTGLTTAAEDGKCLMVYFWRHGCSWCKKMEKSTFSNETVIDLVGAYFAPAKVNTGSNDIYHTLKGNISAKQLAKSFKIRGVPATYFLNQDGAIITSLPGFVPADKFEIILKYIGEEHYKDKTMDEYIKTLKQSS